MEGNAHADTLSGFNTPPSTGTGISDTVRNAASSVADKSQDALNAVKEKASDLPVMLADRLDAGADAIQPERQAGATGVATDDRMTQVTDKLATGMHASADWLRDADMNKLKGAIEQQVRERPGRSLLIALGVGYVVGKAVRR